MVKYINTFELDNILYLNTNPSYISKILKKYFELLVQIFFPKGTLMEKYQHCCQIPMDLR